MLDVALIGMPRSGTSSLFYWLAQHPVIAASQPKETFFFMDSAHPLCGRHGLSLHRDGLSSFDRFFSGRAVGKLRMEATTHYFYQATALKQFGSWNERPLVIALVRDPGSRLRSEFYYTQENIAGIDRALTFSRWTDALLQEEMRSIEPFYIQKSSYWIACRQLDLSCYVKWLRRWAGAVGRDRLVVISFDELRKSPLDVLHRVCERLGCDLDGLKEISVERANASFGIRWQGLHRSVRKWARMVPAGRWKGWMATAYQRVQSRGAIEKDDVDQKAVELINDRFRPWNLELMQEFGVDTSDW